MHEHFHRKFKQKLIVLAPGEYHATGDPVILSTLLGSCIATCLYDPERHIIGMNHFLLAGNIHQNAGYFASDSGRYGIHAMELLINNMMKLGARRSAIKAKAFGGAHVLHSVDAGFNGIPESNVQFIKTFLETEQIELVSDDLGGLLGRKIYFFNKSFKVLLKRLDSSRTYQAEKEQTEYWKRQRIALRRERLLRKKKPENIEFFD